MRPAVADAIYWSAVVCCIVAQIAILRSALARHRPPAGAPDTLPPVRRGVELVGAVLPALALVGVLAFTWRAVRTRAGALPGAVAPAAETYSS